MGMYCEVAATDSAAWSNGASVGSPEASLALSDSVSLEKAWHGLHYLLTGEQWGGQGPLAFLLSGGDAVDDDDGPRSFTPEQTKSIHQALADVSDQQLWSRYDAAQMEALEIYPLIWDEDEEELKEEYLMYFKDLKQVVQVAAESNRGLSISIG